MKREELHAYQNYCIDFIKQHPEALLILEMGLGKTVITLTAIADLMGDSFAVSKVLIIAPLRVARDVWPKEVALWEHTRALRVSVILGSVREREAALGRDADIYVLNRENVKWLVEHLEKEKQPWLFDMCVIDELSSFKNFRSQRWRYLRKVRPFMKRIVGLTGTPTPAGMMDLFGEVGIIDGGKRLGRFIGRYREAFFRPAKLNPYTGVVYDYALLPGAEEKIYSRISDITISMKTVDYLEMPDCVTVTHEVEMNAAERKMYDTMMREMVVKIGGEEIDASNAAVLSGRLMQMAGGAIYNDEKMAVHLHDRKLEMLEDLIEQANGQCVLIAYWFRHERERAMRYLKKLGYEPRDLKSGEDIEDWNAGRIQVALVSPASCGHGLNIQQGGHILIWMTTPWSLELVQQTNCRLWRQGQTETVTIHRIVCKDTIDEDIGKAIEAKDATQERLIAAVKARLRGGKG